MSIAGDSSSTESGLSSDQDSDSTIYDLTTSRLEVREEDNNESREDDRQHGLTSPSVCDIRTARTSIVSEERSTDSDSTVEGVLSDESDRFEKFSSSSSHDLYSEANCTSDPEEGEPDGTRSSESMSRIGQTKQYAESTSGSEDEVEQTLNYHTGAGEEREAVANIMSSRCCDNECLLELTGQMILTAQRKIHSLSRNEHRLWIQDKILENSHMVNDKLEISYYVGGRKVCRAGFQLIYRIPPRSVSHAIKSVIVEHGNKGTKKPT